MMRPEGLTQSHPRAQGNQEPDRYHVEGWAHGHVARVTVPAKQMHGELTHVCKTIVSFHDTEGPKEVACGSLRGPKTLYSSRQDVVAHSHLTHGQMDCGGGTGDHHTSTHRCEGPCSPWSNRQASVSSMGCSGNQQVPGLPGIFHSPNPGPAEAPAGWKPLGAAQWG